MKVLQILLFVQIFGIYILPSGNISCSNSLYNTKAAWETGIVSLSYAPNFADNVKSQGNAALLGVANLTCLHELVITGSDIDDISALSRLTNLKTLIITGTSVTDLSPISNMKDLETLHLPTSVSDLSPISGLAKIKNLDLESSGVSDLSPISGFTNLEELRISEIPVSDISMLSNFKELYYLLVIHTDVTDISPLSDLWTYAAMTVRSNPGLFTEADCNALERTHPNADCLAI